MRREAEVGETPDSCAKYESLTKFSSYKKMFTASLMHRGLPGVVRGQEACVGSNFVHRDPAGVRLQHVLYLAGLTAVPRELYSAAEMDGAASA